MNIFHGIIAGYYLTYLALWGSKRNTGKIFGFGYAFGSIGTFLLSLLFNGSIGHGFIFVIYGFLAVIAIVIHEVSPKYISDENFQEPFDSAKYSRKQLILAIIIVFLLSFVKNIGFYFPTNDFITGSVSPVMTRCFYAVGLIIAGIINDRSRRYGSICCVCVHGISQRESEVLINLLMGLSNPEISEKLYISENTVKFHMRNILKKTGCTKRSEVISLYREYQNNNK